MRAYWILLIGACGLVAACGQEEVAHDSAMAADDAVVAYWTFNEPVGESLRDVVGGHDGHVVNAVQSDIGGAWNFAADSAYVIVPPAEALDLTTGFTIEARVRPTMIGPEASRSGTQSIVEKHMSDGGYLLVLTPEGRIAYWFETPSGRVADTTDVVLAANSGWHDVAMSWDRRTVRIILDGKVVLESPFTETLLPTVQEVFLADDDTHNWGFHGDIDYIRILNEPRTVSTTH